MMRLLIITAHKDLKRRFADPLALLVWIGIPALLGVLLSAIGGSDGSTPTARLLVVNQDDSFVSNLLVGALGQGGVNEFLSVEDVDLDTGRDRINNGDGSALLIVPAGFGMAILEDEPTTLTLLTNPAQRILPGIIVEGLEIFGDAVFYGQRLLGEPIQTIVDGPPLGEDVFPSDTIAALSRQINDRLASASPLLFPPLFDLRVVDKAGDVAGGASGGFDVAQLFLPGMIFMSILFMAQGMSDDLWKEKQYGTLRRVVSSPLSLGVFVAGKLLAGCVLIATVAAMALLVGIVAFQLPPWRAPLAVVWCAFAGTSLLCLFLSLSLLGSEQRTANLVSTMTLFPLMMIGGSFFPFETMPTWMQAIGRWTPNGLAVVQLRTMLFDVPELAAFASATAGIAATAGMALFLCFRRLRGGFVTA